jgi:hypothetical protein
MEWTFVGAYTNEEDLADQAKIINIEKINARWAEAKKNLEDAQYLERLIFTDYVNSIRSFKTTWDYRITAIENARSEIGKTKKKERENLSYIEKSIKEDFFESENWIEPKITEIISGGYESYYWLIYFKICDIEYGIQIPVKAALTTKNIEYAHKGKFVFLKKESSSCTRVLCDDWTESGLSKQIEEYFRKESNE